MLCRCPICSHALTLDNITYKCENGHCFDKAKEGYVNLLLVNKHKSKNPGDSAEMSLARRQFLSSGCYAPLAEKVSSVITQVSSAKCPSVLDACCGEGYYTEFVRKQTECDMYGFDISKSMIKLAARHGTSNYFVAGINDIPVFDSSFDVVMHLFALFNEDEFSRILKDDGTLISVSPGSEHLWELKKLLYDTPYKNDEQPPETVKLKLYDTIRLRYQFEIGSNENLQSLFMMTPYFYKTSKESAVVLDSIENLKITADFLIRLYKH